MNAQQIINQLQLVPHVEGGYYRRIYEANTQPPLQTNYGERLRLTSIHYLLSSDSPVGRWHLNRSDILHYYHLGDAITYTLIYPNGRLQEVVLGADLSAGQCLHFTVPGGVWKATRLHQGEFGLLSEAVCPGFDFADMQLGDKHQLVQMFPRHRDVIESFY